MFVFKSLVTDGNKDDSAAPGVLKTTKLLFSLLILAMPRTTSKKAKEEEDDSVNDYKEEKEKGSAGESFEEEESAYEESSSGEENEVSEEYESDETESSYSASEVEDDGDHVYGYGIRQVGRGRGRPRGRPTGSGRGGYGSYPGYVGYGYFQQPTLPPLLVAAVERTQQQQSSSDGSAPATPTDTAFSATSPGATSAQLLQEVVKNTVSTLADAVGPVGRRLPTILPRTPEATSQMKTTVSQELKESISSLLMDPATRAALLEKLRAVQMPPLGPTAAGVSAPYPPSSVPYSYPHPAPHLPPIFRPPPSQSTILGPRKLNISKTAVLRDLEEAPTLTSTRSRRAAAVQRVDYSKFYKEDADEEETEKILALAKRKKKRRKRRREWKRSYLVESLDRGKKNFSSNITNGRIFILNGSPTNNLNKSVWDFKGLIDFFQSHFPIIITMISIRITPSLIKSNVSYMAGSTRMK